MQPAKGAAVRYRAPWKMDDSKESSRRHIRCDLVEAGGTKKDTHQMMLATGQGLRVLFKGRNVALK
jgi:hypothetical protein